MSSRPSAARRIRFAFAAVLLTTSLIAPSATSVVAGSRDGSGPTTASAIVGPKASSTDQRLRGGLKTLVRAARSGKLGSGAYSGYVTASAGTSSGVAVSLQLAPSGGDTALQSLLANGARVANRNGAAVEAYLPSAALADLGTLPGIAEAVPIIRPVPLGTGLGTTVGEGVALHKANLWQMAGIDGTGVKVGIIDGGFVGLTARLGTELPATVHARCYKDIGIYSSAAKSCETDTEHGTAVAETISDMAPGANLYLADPVSPQDLASTVEWMTSNGVKVINVSLGFAFEGPGDTSTAIPGSVYAAVNQAVNGGALWVNSAGNAGTDGWTGTWKDADHDDLLEFSGSDESNSLSLESGESIVVSIRWNEPWGKSANDYDLYVFGPNGTIPVAASEDTQDGKGDPVESLAFTPSSTGTYRIEIERAGGSSASKIQLLVLTSQDAPLTHRVAAGTLPSPADSASPGEISVGAVPFDAPDTVEEYSSRGPTPDGRVKPDLVAADCTTTSIVNPFCGTSESSPYVTGAAALVLQSRPALTPAQLADFLRSHADPLGSPVPNSTSGSGRLDLGQAPQPPTPTALAFTKAPTIAVAQAPIVPPIAVTIRDQDGVPVTAGAGATALVTMALGSAPAGAALACPGGLTQTAVAGVATFAGCTISVDGSGVTLTAMSGVLPVATSAPFNVLPAGSAPTPKIATSVSATAITWGSAVTIRGALSLPANAPVTPSLAGRIVTFEGSSDRTNWHSVGQGTSDASGVASISYRPVTNLYYRTTIAVAGDLRTATGSTARVTVRQTASMRPTNSGRTKTIKANTTIVFTTTVRPARTDVSPGAVTFELWHLTGSSWRRIAVRTVTPSATGIASVSATFVTTGTWYIRSMAAPTKVNANSVWTPQERYLVK